MGEQEGGEHIHRLARTIAAMVEQFEKFAPRAGRRAPLRHIIGDKGIEPVLVAEGEKKTGHHAERHEQRRGQDVPFRAAYGGRKPDAEKVGKAAPKAGADAVDLQIGARRQAFEIAHGIDVERDAARHRERGKGGPVEARQLQQLLGREAARAARFGLQQDVLKIAPARFALTAKGITFEVFGRHMSSWRLIIR